jgi:hypothetical protein
MVSLKLEIYIFTVAKTKLKLTRSTRKALSIVSTLRMRIDVVVLVENTRRIFDRAREGNLGSRRIFLTVLSGHKKLLAGRYLPTPGLANRLIGGGKVTALCSGRALLPRNIILLPVLISVRGRVKHWVLMRLEELGKLKNPFTSSGLEPATFLLMA